VCPMPTEWNLYYPSWMISDGEPDREVGQSFEWFAIEFWTMKGLARTDERSKAAIPIADCKYHVVAELTYISDKVCVIDFSLKAISTLAVVLQDLLPPGYKLGDYVTGEIGIGIPLCTELVPEHVLKSLAHKWQVNRISADLTPYIEQPEQPNFFVRDESQIRYEEVNSTDAVSAQGYMLHCSEIG